MRVRNTRARLVAILFTSLFSSIAFAGVSQAPDSGALDGTDVIDWQKQGVLAGEQLLSTDVSTDAGNFVSVTKTINTPPYVDEIPSPIYLPNADFDFGDWVLDTADGGNDRNFLSISYVDGRDFCGLGTEISPQESGGFEAQIRAFNAKGSMDFFPVDGDNTIPGASFIGIMSDTATPMNRVEIHIESTDEGGNAAAYAINQVELKECPTEPPPPEVTAISCESFAAPMANHPVKAKKNRVFPLKMELFDENDVAQTDVELVAAPVVAVTYSSDAAISAIYTGDVLTAGHGSDGNMFDFTDDDIWQFNLKSKGLASGTYFVTVVSGDATEYVINSTCETSFTIK